MNYRKVLSTGAACAAIGLMAGGLLAQVGQQRPQQQRPGIAMTGEGRQFLQQLEGNWNVEVVVHDPGALDHQWRDRDRMAPGVGGEAQLRTNIEQSFVRAGVPRTEAQREAERLARRIAQERPSQREIERMLEQSMTQAGVGRTQAQREAQQLAPTLHRGVEDRPGASAEGQLRTNIEQSYVRLGFSRPEAQQEADRLARRIAQERPAQTEIERMLEQSMTQAGVDRTQARQEAQRLAPTLHRLADRPHQPGLRPEDDHTSAPITPRDPDRPGVERDFDRPGVARDFDRRDGHAQMQAQGMARRNWILNENILQEDVSFSQISPGMQRGQQQRPGQARPGMGLQDGGVFEGHAMFGFDPQTNMICHVWADSSRSNMYYSLGRIDPQAREVTFYTIDTEQFMHQIPDTRRPATRPGFREERRGGVRGPAEQYGQDRPDRDRDLDQDWDRERHRDWDRDRRDRVGATDRLVDERGGRVVLRIISDNEHTVTYYRTNPTGEARPVMEVFYTRWN